MIAELIETGLVIISSGIGTVIGFSIGRKEKKIQHRLKLVLRGYSTTNMNAGFVRNVLRL